MDSVPRNIAFDKKAKEKNMKKDDALAVSMLSFLVAVLPIVYVLFFQTGCAGYRWAPTSMGRILPYVEKIDVLVVNLRSYSTCFTQVSDDGYPALGGRPICILPGREGNFELIPHLTRVKVYGLKGVNDVELLYGLYFRAHSSLECISVDKLYWNKESKHCNILVLHGYPVTTYTGSIATETARMQWPDKSIHGLIREEVSTRAREYVRDIFFKPQDHVPAPPTTEPGYDPEKRTLSR
ncbi:MAG: hypothetical protein A3B74_02275 [Candidatus Kerfeldbacteria bacterium RIFCSPHIGHO2_02_FULL_42_14]|uniref:Uncharacterized protein n=1 Tax=Candidatus Kerfeldbacteria bacterium RIFCSPHIGHO2_02_FULL_42_14 TaxID=1798540 RepID=A0A1G2ARP6_9BACT|nr:MAG: hypothetical protein A3B74_02275 [Candidatus Kerfeldbacteria bacterium RIFCSPHIGHO2_02_FULL_42_14]OGY80375.1 MAG: hypothetical protein A3E60_04895 [Candidatus Kerfeldbacteria bacterium RIFCSPHIGHO2_12_FULL_42_13]OGY83804.1 MAG: hypothetical protein A3I91_04420 [Candidatus Kerfeldbacteria bacterium RIFCSPLOWO2_02_FULL_42_19]